MRERETVFEGESRVREGSKRKVGRNRSVNAEIEEEEAERVRLRWMKKKRGDSLRFGRVGEDEESGKS